MTTRNVLVVWAALLAMMACGCGKQKTTEQPEQQPPPAVQDAPDVDTPEDAPDTPADTGAIPDEVVKNLRDKLDKMDSEDSQLCFLDPEEVLTKAEAFFAKEARYEQEGYDLGRDLGTASYGQGYKPRTKRRWLSYFNWGRQQV